MTEKGRPYRPKKKPIKLTEKELAVLQAIKELGERALVGEILKRANEILDRKRMH